MYVFFFFSSRRRHTRLVSDWSSDVCSSDLGELTPDGEVLHPGGDVSVTKAAIDPVWWLPGIAERFGVQEHQLRRTLFEQTGGMYPELVTRPDLSVFLPPIGGITLYIFGDVAALTDPRRTIAC